MNIPFIPKISPIRENDISRDITRKKPVETSSRADKVTIFDESRLVSNLLVSMKQMNRTIDPDLSKLRDQVSSGNYNPSSRDIARAILYGPPEK